MEGGDVYDKQKWGDGGTLRDPDRDGSKEARGPLERQAAGVILEERTDPLAQVWGDHLDAEVREECGRFLIIEASFHIKKEGGDLVAEAMEGLNIML